MAGSNRDDQLAQHVGAQIADLIIGNTPTIDPIKAIIITVNVNEESGEPGCRDEGESTEA
jgi:hypothetical protein